MVAEASVVVPNELKRRRDSSPFANGWSNDSDADSDAGSDNWMPLRL